MSVLVEHFDDLFHGDPATIEAALKTLRPHALAHFDESLAPQIESQIALAQAMLGRFAEAFATLDRAGEEFPGAGQPVARVRLLIERGRVFHQSRRLNEALPWFVAAHHIGLEHGLDFHTINAAHMAAIVETIVEEKIRWNRLALEQAEATADGRARAWRSILNNNLAQAFVAAGRFEEARLAFERCGELASERGEEVVARGARWGVARALRSMGRSEEAKSIQQQLLEEYDEIGRTGKLPAELVAMARGVVHEELAELVHSRSAEHARRALNDLGVNSWFRDLEPARWVRLENLSRTTDE